MRRKELVGIVVACVAVALLAGVLTLAFRDRGQNQQSVLGGGATSTTPSELPMTVTTDGVAVTLESIQISGNNTRIDFSVPVPADLTTVDGRNVIAFNPSMDIEIDGTAVSPHGWTNAGIGQHKEGETATSFWFVLGSPLKLDGNPTISLKQFDWVPASGTTQTVKGPWTFKITPGMLASQVRPTPNSQGDYSGLTVEQAQRLVDFPIVEPSPLPDMLSRQEFNTFVSTVASNGPAGPNLITQIYTMKQNIERGVKLQETTVETAQPSLQGKGIRSVITQNTPTIMPLGDVSQSTLSIDDTTSSKSRGRHLVPMSSISRGRRAESTLLCRPPPMPR